MHSFILFAERSCYCFAILLAVFLISSCTNTLPPGDADNGGLSLPVGFEAVVVADSVGRARHMAVRDNGDIYVKLRTEKPEGENVALRDTDGDGKADVIKLWGSYDSVSNYGTAMRIHNDYLYLSTAGEVYRHKLSKGKLVPEDKGQLIVFDDYKNAEYGSEHIAKPIAFDNAGHLYVPFGSPGDVCQIENRKPGSLGQYPCPQLEWHGGVWQFDEAKPNQLQRDGKLYATGIRSIVAMDWNNEQNTLYALQHGRDNFSRTWPEQFSAWQSALLPAEEFLRVEEGTDAGWPYFYYDQLQDKKLINPEYVDYADQLGSPLDYEQPLIGFPGHFAPNDLLFYNGDQFPEHYRNGAFIAFHGSTIRAPYPQGGYFVAFVPFKDGMPSGPWEVFADGFAGVDTIVNTSDAAYRPMGLAIGPDGSLYMTESEKGKIWRIMFKGDKENFGTPELAEMEKHKQLPHIKDPDEVLDNLDKGRAKAGEKLYVTYCGACHLQDGKGDGTRYPPINSSEWVSGDEEWLINLILKGREGEITVNGQSFEGVMPAFDYLADEQIAQILTYIRQSFGNDAPSIQAVEVERMRRRNKRLEQQQAEEDI